MISIKENEIISKIILPDKIQRYVKVPKEIILAKDLPEHRISTLLYLNYNQTWDEVVHYSPIYMIQWSGYKPSWNRSNKSNIYEKFKSCMDWCFLNGYLLDYDETKYVQSKYQTSLLNIEKIRPADNFGLLYDFEIDFIKNYKSPYKNLNTSIILLILSYIRAFAWNRTNEVYDHSNTSKKEKPEIFHAQFQDMEYFTGISSRLISKVVDVLKNLGIVETYRMPNYKDSEGNWHNEDTIFVFLYKYKKKSSDICRCSNEEYDFKTELENGIEYIKNQKYSSKKFYQD